MNLTKMEQDTLVVLHSIFEKLLTDTGTPIAETTQPVDEDKAKAEYIRGMAMGNLRTAVINAGLAKEKKAVKLNKTELPRSLAWQSGLGVLEGIV